MTKIKNTKKGMAKKTLSMSLVVAMLATSNVPVWASEFSAGDDVSAFSAEADAPVVENEEFTDDAVAATAVSNITSVVFQENGDKIDNEVEAKAGNTLTATATLNDSFDGTGTVSVKLMGTKTPDNAGSYAQYAVNKITNKAGDTFSVTYDLKPADVGTTFKVVVSVNDGADLTEASATTVVGVKAKTVLTGTPTIDSNSKNTVVLGTKLTANTDNMGPTGTAFKYQWQTKNDNGEWVNIPAASNKEYIVNDSNRPANTTTLYGKEVRVGVYAGVSFENAKVAYATPVFVGAKELDTAKVHAAFESSFSSAEKEFSTTPAKNELLASEITVTYDSTALTYGEDYTLSYDQLYHLGAVKVTVNIIPTSKTGYSSGKLSNAVTYNLVAKKALDGYAVEKVDKTYEYTGQKITPEVAKVTADGQILNASEYKVQEIGPDAGEYTLSVATDKTIVYKDSNKHEVKVIIDKKDMANHDGDFEVVIPEDVWKEDTATVVANADHKIKMYDTAVDPNKTNDLLAGKEFTIECVNWSVSSVNKNIKITANASGAAEAKNYKGSVTRQGDVTKRDINEFKSAFRNSLSSANNLIYNGKEQDYLGQILSANSNRIDLTGGPSLFLNKDFTYKIIQGGTDAGYVSYIITGAGDYANTEMTLSNVYKIKQATFNDDKQVKDNTTGNELEVTFNPALGNKGADIRNYNILAKDVYKAWIVDSNNKKTYDLVLGKDFWLDKEDVSATTVKYTPTVAENKVQDHGKNENFKQTPVGNATEHGVTNRADITATLVPKNLNDKDITVKVIDASYNSGNLVTPTVKVVYTDKDGKEYEISKDYYTVEFVTPAMNEGATGMINVKAKSIIDTATYPQKYTGNKRVEYTVGTPSLEGGKIVATNGLETLPSVAYSAEQAASTKGIILEAGKYVVKDKSGNVVDPKYYDVTFSDNKKAGTATITVTGKAPYKGSVSANFKITNATLPSGTVTLMSDKLSKAYTGEEISLVKGTDYVITGELAKLTEGTDYMVSYENAVNVTTAGSKAKIKFVGIGSYAGELVKTFDITPAKITASDVTLGDTTYSSGMTVKPSVTITVPGGKTALVEGTDYTVDYVPAATNVGDKGKVVITYKDNKNLNTADSVKEVEYGVTAKDLKDVTVAAIANQEATGEQIKPAVTVMNGSVKLTEGKDYEVVYGDNKAIGEGTVTVKALDSNKNYTGSQTVKFNIVESAAEIGTPVISSVKVVGNKATVILSGDAEGASGYDYVISTDKNCTTSKDYDAISKNQVQTSTAFKYVQKGTYYAYCHAWTRDKNGKKVFGEWSEGYEFKVKATTPAAPVITDVKVKGSTITVTYNKVSNAAGYDVVLGTSSKNDNGELRPYRYGDHKILNISKNKVTVQFKNVPKKNWVVGMRSFTKDPDTNKKVFSRWSNLMPAKVK